MTKIDPFDVEAVVARAQEIKKAHPDFPWRAIARELDVPEMWLRRRCDPVWAAKARATANKAQSKEETRRRALAGAMRDRAIFNANPKPTDSRTFTQQFFGDPLPGRSALDQKKAGGKWPV